MEEEMYEFLRKRSKYLSYDEYDSVRSFIHLWCNDRPERLNPETRKGCESLTRGNK